MKKREVTECQVKANNLWALLVDILSSPTLNPDLDYSERWCLECTGQLDIL